MLGEKILKRRIMQFASAFSYPPPHRFKYDYLLWCLLPNTLTVRNTALFTNSITHVLLFS